MQPAFSVIFLTTLIGAAQGLFLAVFAVDLVGLNGLSAEDFRHFGVTANVIALLLTGLGLFASFFHLGHPERAWRSATMWRTSWLSREVIALPVFMAGLFAYGLAMYLGLAGTASIGAVVSILCLVLFVCTGMVYASIRFLQEWASPLTLVNYLLLGCASGFTLATMLAAMMSQPLLVGIFAPAAIVTTLLAWVGRAASLVRNARIKPKSTLQSAIGIKHPRIVQKAQGFMGGSFNTKEFFHGKTPAMLRSVKWVFLVLVFPVPVLFIVVGLTPISPALLVMAFVLQYLGLLAERWFFFAQANHPQNLYYQTIS